MDHHELEDIVRLGARVPVGRRGLGNMDGTIINIAVPDRVVEARSAATTTASSSTSTSSCGANACETGTSQVTFTMPIILGVA